MKKYFLLFVLFLLLPINSYGNETENYLCDRPIRKFSPEMRKLMFAAFKNRVDALITAEEIKALDAVETEENVINEIKNRLNPDGHFKIPHLWPGQNPPA